MKADIKTAIDSVLSANGFKRRSNNWIRLLSEVSLMINLQKSNWGNQYYINVGVNPKVSQEHDSTFSNIPIHRYPIGFRIEDIVNIEQKRLDILLDAENASISSSDRLNGIKELLCSAIPFLETLLTLDGIAQAYRDGKFKDMLIHKGMIDILDRSSF